MSPPLSSGRAIWLLECLLPERHCEAVLGDLIEEYGLRQRSESRARASQWYWNQVVTSVPRLAWSAFVAGPWYRGLGIGLSVLLAISLTESATNAAIAAIVPLSHGTFTVVSVLVGFVSLVAGGYLAAWFRTDAAFVFAAAQIVIVLAFMRTNEAADFPLWLQVGFFILCPAASLGGGILCRLRGRGRTSVAT